MKRILILMLLAGVIISVCQGAPKPRIVVMTDIGGDPDDCQSMVRFLLYTCDFEVEGLCTGFGHGHYKNTRLDLIHEAVDAYGKVVSNLRKHSADYPFHASLKDLIKGGHTRRHMLKTSLLFTTGFAARRTFGAHRTGKSAKQPNVIFFALDDLCDWIGPLGHSQAITPNFDRLAQSGVTFTNAHTAGVFCAPSRTAIFTGKHVTTTGCYREDVFHYDHPNIVTLQMVFQQGGYKTFGAGKLYHHMPGFVDLRGWDKHFTRSQEVKDMG